MSKHLSKSELINFFMRYNQKKHNGGGIYLHNFEDKPKSVEKEKCGKKSLT